MKFVTSLIKIIICLAIVLGGAWYVWTEYFQDSGAESAVSFNPNEQESLTPPQEPQDITQSGTTAERVAEMLYLEGAGEPVVSLIIDAERLRSEQSFYANVELGDYLLVYPDIQKAVIYSPSKDKLMNIGPVVIE